MKAIADTGRKSAEGIGKADRGFLYRMSTLEKIDEALGTSIAGNFAIIRGNTFRSHR